MSFIDEFDEPAAKKKVKNDQTKSYSFFDYKKKDAYKKQKHLKSILNFRQLVARGSSFRQSSTWLSVGRPSALSANLESWLRQKQLLIPEDQVKLADAELDEEIAITLVHENPHTIENLVTFSFKDGEFKPEEPHDVTANILLLSIHGTAIHIDSNEAKEQLLRGDDYYAYEILHETKESAEPPPVVYDDELEDEDVIEEDEYELIEDEFDEEYEEEEDNVEEEEKVEVEKPKPKRKKRKLINQFNYCERAALTHYNPNRHTETQTVPPVRSIFKANASQWVIYDSLQADWAIKMREQEEREAIMYNRILIRDTPEQKYEKYKLELNRKYVQAWKTLERIINQNIYDEVSYDYRYFEDPSDEFRNGEGTLLPLWKFSFGKTENLCITDVLLNTYYYDLFGVLYGSFDFMKSTAEGGLCLFTIKNPSYPEYHILFENSGICGHIHPKYPYLIAVGFDDGVVCVYSVKSWNNEPIYKSTGVFDKHAECVTDIRWGPDTADGELSFYTISIDGQVLNWTLMQDKFLKTSIITLYMNVDPIKGPDDTLIKLKHAGTCFTFHPDDIDIFLVGTENGKVHKCNTKYTSKYMMTYEGHYLSVYQIDYNKFNSNIFITCGADWKVKVWEDMRIDPLFIFDLGSSVNDVKWAPYSSTVFGAVTSEGKVYVYDLNVNKYKPICAQVVVSKGKTELNTISFNKKLPFIIVGDSRGTATTLKLSPNLRLQVKPPKKGVIPDQRTLQIQKLAHLLSLVRESDEVKTIKSDEHVADDDDQFEDD